MCDYVSVRSPILGHAPVREISVVTRVSRYSHLVSTGVEVAANVVGVVSARHKVSIGGIPVELPAVDVLLIAVVVGWQALSALPGVWMPWRG